MKKMALAFVVMCLCGLLYAGELFQSIGVPPYSPLAGRMLVRSEGATVQCGLLAERAPASFDAVVFGDRLRLVRDRVERRGADEWTWFGRISGNPNSTVIMLVKKGRVAGIMHTGTNHYSLWPMADGMVEIAEFEEAGYEEQVIDMRHNTGGLPVEKFARQRAAAGTPIRVLFLATDAAIAQAESVVGMPLGDALQLSIDITNQACVNSQIPVRFESAGYRASGYPEDGPGGQTVLERMTQWGDGYFEDILRWKYAARADIAVSLRAMAPVACAFIANADTPVFAVAEVGLYNLAPLAQQTVTHEVGHTMGNTHDWYVSPGEWLVPYAHGYYFMYPENWIGSWQGFKTIMAYPYGCGAYQKSCEPILYWSTPKVNYNGYPIGVAVGASSQPCDVARAMTETAPLRATWRDYIKFGSAMTLSETSHKYSDPSYDHGFVQMTTGQGCEWTVASDADWLVIKAVHSYLCFSPIDMSRNYGSGSVEYKLVANTGKTARTGHIMFTSLEGFQPPVTLTVTQDASSDPGLKCVSQLMPESQSYNGQPMANASVRIWTTQNYCTWTAISNANWLTITTPTGTGQGYIYFNLAGNYTGASRTARITVTTADSVRTFDAIQVPTGCTVSIDPPSPPAGPLPSAGASGQFSVVTGCYWTASTGSSWIHCAGSGSGNGTMIYTVDANAGANDRYGSITVSVGAQSAQYSLGQQGLASQCNITLSPRSASHGSGNSNGSIALNIPSTCTNPSYTASSNASWLRVTSGASGSLSGTITYTVDENTGPNGRSGSICTTTGVGNQNIFSVTQQAPGITCSFNVGAFSTSWAGAGGAVVVPVTASAAGCAWNTSSNAAWITLNPASCTGTGAATMIVAENGSADSRSGVVSIAGYDYLVTQEAASPDTGVTITAITSKKSTPGAAATIRGTGFLTTKGSNTVKFGTLMATVGKKLAATGLAVTIPKGCKKGTTYQVVVTVKGKGSSNPYAFTVK